MVCQKVEKFTLEIILPLHSETSSYVQTQAWDQFATDMLLFNLFLFVVNINVLNNKPFYSSTSYTSQT